MSPGAKLCLVDRYGGYTIGVRAENLSSADKTAAQLLADLDKFLAATHQTHAKAAGGYRTPSLGLADGTAVSFASDDALRAYLQRSAAPLASAEQVDALYRAVLGRGAGAGEVAAAQDALAASGSVQGGSLDEVRRGLASSPEASTAVAGLYRAVLGREASAAEVAGFRTALVQGGSLQEVRGVLAHSAEARSDVAEVYRRGLGREADAGGLSSAEAALAGGGTLAQVRAGVASSAEAQARAGAIYRAALGREASSGEVAGVQAALAGGGSVEEVRAAVARSPEAAARVSGVFEAVLGRTPEGTGWMQEVLARGGTAAEVRAGLAYSDEAAGAIRGAYLQALGRDADAAGVAYWRERLAAGASLSEVRASLAASPEAASRVSAPSVEVPAPEGASGSGGGSAPEAAPAPGGGGAVADGVPAVSPVAGFLMPAPAAAETATAEGALSWLARNGLRAGTGLGTAAVVLVTPLNARTTAVEAGVEGHPEWGARVERAPGSRSGSVVVYERGADGQPGRELARLGLDVQERLVSPGAEMGGGVAFGALTGAGATDTGSTGGDAAVGPEGAGSGEPVDGVAPAAATAPDVASVQPGDGAEAAPTTAGDTVAGQEQAGQDPAAPSTPPLQTGYSFEIRDAAESAIVAAGQAQNKSQQDIQTELDNHRQNAAGGTGTGGAQGPTGVAPSGDSNQESVIVQLEPGVLEAPGGIGRMKLERTPGLGDKASMSELVQSGAVPGSEGVILTDEVGSPTQLYGDMWQLSQQNGVEYLLTREADKLVLYSGAETAIPLPRNAEILAHTHPYDVQSQSPQTMPSLADINALNTIWGLTPDAERPMSDIIWGPDPEHVTTFGATGIDRISDPTKGGLKPGRTW